MCLLAAAALPLAACATTPTEETVASVTPDPTLGQPVAGVPGAVWADQNNDGRVDGYVQNGEYHAGAPTTYQSSVTPASCTPVSSTAIIGGAVSGVSGAIWADQNNDGCVDGYVREGRYYSGAPMVQPAAHKYTGERG
jgi:hypothetical protein